VRKLPLYADVRKTGGKEETRGSGRKRKAGEMVASSGTPPGKENVMPDCAQPAEKRSTMTAVGARQVLDAILIDWNR
jgi:hypothetical protein